MKIKKVLAGILLVLLVLAAVFGIYVSDSYRADEAALEALMSDDAVRVERRDYGYLFDGPSKDRALVFYPGAKVQAEAYAPLLHLLAGEGMDVCLAEVPFGLAILDTDAASGIMEEEAYEDWYVGGHSLGGAMAAWYASDHGDSLKGLVLLAAYPTRDLEDSLTEVLVYGSEDLVVNREKIEEGEDYAPDHLVLHVIEGGNHAGFGSYGDQKGDGRALIPAAAQREETVRAILEGIEGD